MYQLVQMHYMRMQLHFRIIVVINAGARLARYMTLSLMCLAFSHYRFINVRENATLMERGGNKSEVIRTPTDDFGDRHTNQLILRSLRYNISKNNTLLKKK